MAGINGGNCGYFAWAAKARISTHFPAIIGIAYSNNGPFDWFLHMIMRVLPIHFLVSRGFDKVQG
jgi:hypothetical protein